MASNCILFFERLNWRWFCLKMVQWERFGRSMFIFEEDLIKNTMQNVLIVDYDPYSNLFFSMPNKILLIECLRERYLYVKKMLLIIRVHCLSMSKNLSKLSKDNDDWLWSVYKFVSVTTNLNLVIECSFKSYLKQQKDIWDEIWAFHLHFWRRRMKNNKIDINAFFLTDNYFCSFRA